MATKEQQNKDGSSRKKIWLLGFFSGLLNGLFGAGGGMVCVPALKLLGVPPKKAHATSLAVIWPLTLATLLLSAFFQDIPWKEQPFLPLFVCGIFGATLGALVLKKIKPVWLGRLFGGLLVASAVWILFQW